MLGGEYPSPPNEARNDCSAADICRNKSGRVTELAYDCSSIGGGGEGTGEGESVKQRLPVVVGSA